MAKLKIGHIVALIGIVAAAALVVVAYEWGSDKSLAEPKAWEPRTLAFGKGSASLRTAWRDGRILYQLRVAPYPPEAITAAKEPPSTLQRQFKMEFLDADGFRLFSHAIEAKELSLVMAPDGTVMAVEARGDREISRDAYRRADAWQIRWSYD